MLTAITHSASRARSVLRRHWLLLLGVIAVFTIVTLAVELSDVQGRMDLPLAYSIGMTCEDDPEATLWSGGCDRIADDIARTGRPGFGELYSAFVTVHHAPSPREAAAARFGHQAGGADFDLAAFLKGQRYGLASVTPEFEGVQSRSHAEAVMDAVDVRDRALLTIGRAGLGFDALIAGALANLVHPGALLDGVAQYIAVLTGTAKRSDFASGAAERR